MFGTRFENEFETFNPLILLIMKAKMFFTLVVLLFTSSFLMAQDEPEEEMQTLFGDEKLTFGGYGGPRVAFSSFDNNDIWLVGGRGGVIINHCFVIGGAGYGIVNSPRYNDLVIDDTTYPNLYLQGGYGGLLLEGIIWSRKLVHFSVPVLIGAGGVMFSDKRYPDGDEDYDIHVIEHTPFFVIEPGIEVELNVVRFMRLAAGVSYRYAPKAELPNIASNAFNSLNVSLSFKFGNF
jgi:hypothetical protein